MRPSWDLVRDARHSAGLTQSETARAAGLTQAAVAHMERPGSNPTVKSLRAVLRAMDHQLVLHAEPHQLNVDRTLLARNLRMSPADRLARFETAHAETAALRGLISHGRTG